MCTMTAKRVFDMMKDRQPMVSVSDQRSDVIKAHPPIHRVPSKSSLRATRNRRRSTR